MTDDAPASPVSRVALAALLLFVTPLFGLQAVVLVGVVASANGFGRFVPGLRDVDGDGTREIVVGCPDDPYVQCDWTSFGPVRVATSAGPTTLYLNDW